MSVYEEMKENIKQKKGLSLNKVGFKVPNVFAINPINNEKVCVYLVDYVLKDYGTGVIMGVPGHDERDREFAEKYNISY